MLKSVMRGLLAASALALIAATSGCISTLDSAYDEAAQRECENDTRVSDRGSCMDRVDDHRRTRDGH